MSLLAKLVNLARGNGPAPTSPGTETTLPTSDYTGVAKLGRNLKHPSLQPDPSDSKISEALFRGVQKIGELKMSHLQIVISQPEGDLARELCQDYQARPVKTVDKCAHDYVPADPQAESVYTKIGPPMNGPTSYSAISLVAPSTDPADPLGTKGGYLVVTRLGYSGSFLPKFVEGVDGNFRYKNTLTYFGESSIPALAALISSRGLDEKFVRDAIPAGS